MPQPKKKLPKGFSLKYRLSDIKGPLNELICPHGIGHDEGVHGCDGCCSKVFKFNQEKEIDHGKHCKCENCTAFYHHPQPKVSQPSPSSSGMGWKIEFFESFTDSMQPLLEIAEKKRSIENWNEEMMRSYRIAESFISQAISEAKEETRKECYTDLRKGLMSLDEARADERRKVGEKIRNIVTENAGDCSAIVYKVMDFLTKEK